MSPELIKSLEQIALKHGKQMAMEVASAVAFPALEAAVKASSSPIDDVILAALEQPLKDQLQKLLDGWVV